MSAPEPISKGPGTGYRYLAFSLTGLVGLLVLAMLFFASQPGTGGPMSSEGSLGLILLLVILGANAIVITLYAIRARRMAWWFFLAPAMAVMLLALLHWEVPIKSRFSASEGSFQSVLSDIKLGGSIQSKNWTEVNVPSTMGMYEIETAYVSNGSVIFVGNSLVAANQAGFAYLPKGVPTNIGTSPLKQPRFRQITGPWYSWTAST